MRPHLLVILSLFAVASMIVCDIGEATVYQGTAAWNGTNPCLTLSVAIDTENDVWTACWEGEGYILTPAPGIFSYFKIVFSDGKGFYRSYNSFEDDISHRGSITIENYGHTGCWTHTWCRWSFMVVIPPGIIGLAQFDLWINLYLAYEGEDNPVGRERRCHINRMIRLR